MSDFDSVKKYLKPAVWGLAFGGCILAVGAAAAICFRDELIFVVLGTMMALIGAWIAGLTLNNILKFNRRCSELADSAESTVITTEFSEPEYSPVPELKLGDNYIFAAKSGVFFTYDDIMKVHTFIHRTNGVEDWRELRAKTSVGTVTLAKLKSRGKGDEAAKEIVSLLLTKNPNITVGDKK